MVLLVEMEVEERLDGCAEDRERLLPRGDHGSFIHAEARRLSGATVRAWLVEGWSTVMTLAPDDGLPFTPVIMDANCLVDRRTEGPYGSRIKSQVCCFVAVV